MKIIISLLILIIFIYVLFIVVESFSDDPKRFDNIKGIEDKIEKDVLYLSNPNIEYVFTKVEFIQNKNGFFIKGIYSGFNNREDGSSVLISHDSLEGTSDIKKFDKMFVSKLNLFDFKEDIISFKEALEEFESEIDLPSEFEIMFSESVLYKNPVFVLSNKKGAEYLLDSVSKKIL